MYKERVVIELGHLSVPLIEAVEQAMRADPDEIEIVGAVSTAAGVSNDLHKALERVREAGHVLLTGDVRRPTDGVNVVVLA